MQPSRREFLWQSGGGLGGIALASMLGREGALGGSIAGGATEVIHHAPRAKRVVQLFMAGAASHLDLFDFKPALIKHHGEKSDFGEHVEAFQDGLGPWMKPVWEFKAHGRCGKMLGETVAPLGEVVDEIAFIHNMIGKTGVHSQATYLQATGFDRPGFPGMGCWVSYGLGSMNDNLPTFVVLPDHRGFASNGPKNWGAAFLPAQHQGTIIRPGTANPIVDLQPPASAEVHHAGGGRGRARNPCPGQPSVTPPRGRATHAWRRASRATSWRRACSWRHRRPSISRRSPSTSGAMYGLAPGRHEVGEGDQCEGGG